MVECQEALHQWVIYLQVGRRQTDPDRVRGLTTGYFQRIVPPLMHAPAGQKLFAFTCMTLPCHQGYPGKMRRV